MAKSKASFMKKELEKKKQKKKQDKQHRKEERKRNAKDGSLENMLAYVNEFGDISSTPLASKSGLPEHKQDLLRRVFKISE